MPLDPYVRLYELYRRRRARRPKNAEDLKEIMQAYARWGNAIPAAEWLQVIAARGQPIVEIACGLGYFALKLTQMGVDVTAVDIAPKSTSEHHCRVGASLLNLPGGQILPFKMRIDSAGGSSLR